MAENRSSRLRTLPEMQFPVAPRGVRIFATIALVGIVVAFGRQGTIRLDGAYQPDFEYFYKAGASLLHDGDIDDGIDRTADGKIIARGKLDWYLPFVPRFMTIFALLPLKPAAVCWIFMNIFCVIATVRLIGREFVGFPPQDWAVTQLLPLLLLTRFWFWEFGLNQIDSLTLFLMVLAFVATQRGHEKRAGFWLGLAILIKVTPVLLVVWYALKRKSRTVAFALLTAFLGGPVSDAIVFGPSRAIDLYSQWVTNAVTAGSHRGLILSQKEMDWRNQGWGAIASRWLHRTNWETRFDNDPRMDNSPDVRYLNVADLPLPQVAQVVNILMFASLLLLIWFTRQPAAKVSDWRLRIEWALYLLAMLWMMPVMRRYHMVWAFPAVALIGPFLHRYGVRVAWSKLAAAALAIVVAIQVAISWPIFEAGGALQLGVFMLAFTMITLLVRVRRAEVPVLPSTTEVAPIHANGARSDPQPATPNE
ncbi:MAG: glycosyltransferase family 87 protein [Phycisphaerae bacterium]